MWMSSDEIDVSAEEEVFEITRTWTSFRKSERKKYFAELFREVRLVYVSCDNLHSDVMTNDLVITDDCCMDLVKEALRFIDCKNNPSHTVAPRKSLEIPVMVVCIKCAGQKDSILLYYPREDKWSMFQGAIPSRIDMVSSCCGKVHFLSQKDKKIFQYDLYFNCSTSLPLEEHWRFHNLFVRNEGKIYALVKHKDRRSLNHPLHIIKKKPESNSWDCVSSFDATGRVGTCIVCSNNFIYFIGGTAVTNGPERVLAAADRMRASCTPPPPPPRELARKLNQLGTQTCTLRCRFALIKSRGRGISFIWLIWECAMGQGMVFGLFVLNRVYNFMCLS